VRSGDSIRDAPELVAEETSCQWIDGSKRPGERRAVGDDVGRRSRMDARHSEHCGDRRIHPPRDNGLECADERPSADHRVGRFVRTGSVCTSPDEHDLEVVGRRSERTGLRDDLADIPSPIDMRAEDRGHAIERPRRQHGRRPFAGLLRRLEHDQYIPFRPSLGEQMRGTDRPCRVHIVAAGVHHAGIERGELEAGRLVNRKRIDVTAHRDDRRTTVSATDPRHDAGSGNALDRRRGHGAESRLEGQRRVLLGE
jgi:hypothetical protein